MRNLIAVVLILAAYAIGQTAKTPQAAKAPKPWTPVSTLQENHVGRYQLFFSPHARADTYLVDTETGRIWKPITISNAKDTNLKGPPEIWVYQERIDNEAEFDAWMMLHQPPAPAPPQ